MPSKKEPFDVEAMLDVAEPLAPLPIELRVQRVAEKPYYSTAYLASQFADATPLGSNADRFAPFGFACPVCGKPARVAQGFTGSEPFFLSCEGSCDDSALRTALRGIARLAFEQRDDLLFPFAPDAETQLLDAVEGRRPSLWIDADERGKLKHFRGIDPDITVHRYVGPYGEPVMFVFRRPVGEDGKTFLPAHLSVDAGDRASIVFGYPEGLWPLYGWDELVARPEAPVLAVEGERTAERARELFPDHVVVTSAAGALNAGLTDWSPLHGRDLTIWRDADAPGNPAGITYERAVAAHAHAVQAASVRAVKLPAGLPEGWDLADDLPEGLTLGDLRRLVEEGVAVRWEDVKDALTPRNRARCTPPFRLPDGLFASNKKMVDAVEQALGQLDPGCHRARWMGMLGAVYHALGEAGFALADAWSRRDAEQHRKYKDGEVRRIFDAFMVAPRPTPLPLLALFRAAMKEARERAGGEEKGKDDKKEKPWRPEAAALALAHIAEFEEEHRKLTRGDNVVIGIQVRKADGSYTIKQMQEKNAESVYRSRKAPDFKGNRVSLFALWQNNQLVPPLEQVFRPGGEAGLGELNLFRGFDIQPAPGGSYALLREHIDAIMASNGDNRGFLWNIMAHRLQHLGGFVPSGLAFTGAQGVGKTTLTRVIARLLAPHSVTLSDPDKFLGKNNASLHDKLFVQAEEMDLGRRMDYHHRLMHFVNGETLDLENKYLAQFQAPNHLFIAVTSNERSIVRISADSRRFAVYEVEDRFGGDEAARREWFGRMWAELEAGGYEALAYDLLHTDLEGFSPAVVPKTRLFHELAQVDADRDPLRVWWREVLERGEPAEAEGKDLAWTAPIAKDTLYARYRGWCENDGPRARAATLSKAEWAKQLGKMLPGGLPARRMMVAGTRDHYLVLPPYEECCAHFEKMFGETLDRAPQPGQLRAVM